jgi:hypothetical protein
MFKGTEKLRDLTQFSHILIHLRPCHTAGFVGKRDGSRVYHW